MTIASDVQKLSLDAIVELYELDCTGLGGEIHRFSREPVGGIVPEYGGKMYVPAEFKAEGFELTADGGLPRPTISFSNVNLAMQALVNQLGSLQGALVRRTKTFAKHLDGGPEPDTGQHYPIETYLVSRCVAHQKQYIEWELTSPLDQQIQLPRRQVLRDICPWTYRYYSSGGFDYTQATCPYTGSAYFNLAGERVEHPALDVCGKRLSDCRLRYGNSLKPFGGFPGAARIRR